MNLRPTISVIILAAAMNLSAQTEHPDSLSTAPVATPSAALSTPAGSPHSEKPDTEVPVYHPEADTSLPASTLTAPSFHYTMPQWGRIAAWDNGGLYGETSMLAMPGMMGMETGRLTLTQRFGNLSVSAYAAAVKYGYYGGLTRSLGFGGSISYDFNEHLGVTVFGSYYNNTSGLRPSIAGYMNLTTFGGYFDYSINNRWGVKVGGQSYRTSSGEWHAQPIVMPYYRISKDAAIGIDVGGIIYNAVQQNRERHSHRQNYNPTIAPPEKPVLTVGSPTTNPYGY